MAGSPLQVTIAAVIGFALGAVINIGLTRRTDTPDPVCPQCGSPTSFIGNVPFLSWFRVTLRCSRCDWRETTLLDWSQWIREVATLHSPRGARWSASYLLVGMAYAATCGICVATAGWTFTALQSAAFVSLLLAISISDVKIKIIPGEYTIPGIVVGLAAGIAGAPPGPVQSVLGCLVGAGLIWGLGVVGTWMFKKEAMGGGDIDLMAMVGAFLGVKAVFLTVFLGAAAGTLIYAPLLLIRRDWGQQIPFGVYLATGAVITMAAGESLIAAYLRLVLGP